MRHVIKHPILPFLLVASLCAGTIIFLIQFKVEFLLPYFWPCLYGLMLLLAYRPTASMPHLVLITAIPSFLASVPIVWSNTPSGSIALAFLIIINAYILNAFHIVYQNYGFKMPYKELFYAVWDTFIKLIVAVFFAVICYFILNLWGILFQLINIAWFNTLFSTENFMICFVSMTFSVGLYISTKTEKVIRNSRIIILNIFKALLPVLAIICVLFIAALIGVIIFSSFNPLKFQWSIPTLFCLLAIIFTNAVYQDGTVSRPYPKLLFYLINIFLIIIPILSLFALITLVRTISNDGFNAYNFNQLIILLLLVIYNIIYANIAYRNEVPWLKDLSQTNICLAILVVFTTLLTNNYWFKHAAFNPGRISHLTNITLKSPSSETTPIKTKTPPHPDAKKTLLQKYSKLQKLNWKKVNQDQLKTKALLLGYSNKQPVYLCRTNVNHNDYPGFVTDQGCQIIQNNRLIYKTTYTVLLGKRNQFVWKTWEPFTANSKAIQVIIGLKSPKFFRICRTIYNNQVVIGIAQKNEACRFVVNHTVIKEPSFVQYLFLKLPSSAYQKKKATAH